MKQNDYTNVLKYAFCEWALSPSQTSRCAVLAFLLVTPGEGTHPGPQIKWGGHARPRVTHAWGRKEGAAGDFTMLLTRACDWHLSGVSGISHLTSTDLVELRYWFHGKQTAEGRCCSAVAAACPGVGGRGGAGAGQRGLGLRQFLILTTQPVKGSWFSPNKNSLFMGL